MKVSKTVWIPTAILAATLLTGTANAHPGHGHGKHYDGRPHHGSHWKAPARTKRMPDWLYYKPHFRRWYRNSEVKYNRHLAWRQVYRIYKRQMASRYYRRHDHYYGHGYRPNYDRDWYDDRRRGGKKDKRRPPRRGS